MKAQSSMFSSTHRVRFIGVGLCWALGLSAQAAELFRDDFTAAGNQPDLAKWTTEFGAPSYLGRTQLRDWVSGPSPASFSVSAGQAHLNLDTFNPTGFSLYGTHAKTLQSFLPTQASDIVLTARMQLTTLQPGLVFGIYFYGCTGGPCATLHDELDIELFTNYLQPGSTPRVQLNRYAAEPLGAGHGPVVNLPAGFDALAAHEWTIRWGTGGVSYSLDGSTLFSATNFVPHGAMQANIIAWAPSASDLVAAYSAALQPVNSAGANQTFGALVDWVTVQAVPEPASGLSMALGLVLLALGCRLVGERR
jgi:hypothetical protein